MMAEIEERTRQHPEKIAVRKGLVEHPFGTLKRAMGHGYFLTKGLEKVAGEMSLSVLAYNMKRVLNIVSIEQLMEAVMALKKSAHSFWALFYRIDSRIYLLPYLIIPINTKPLC